MSIPASQATIDEVAVAAEPAAVQIVGRSPWQLFWARFRRDKVALGGLFFIGLLVVLALAAPLISRYVAHHGPNQLFDSETNQIGLPKGPDGHFWFGAD